ncbi:hypothetical protein [Phenylobacterium sp.]|uniref:terminase small subunit-like protein n=1 Tax=Phenylobacterium sp. TaxID=1871053 RepID=UPI003D2E66AE
MSLPDRYRPGLRAELLARLAAGEALKHMCRDEGWPCPASVTGWMRADPEFAAEVRAARSRGEFARRGLAFNETVAAAFLAQARAGRAIEALLRDPAMPSRAVFRSWLAQSPAFAAEVAEVAEVRAQLAAEAARRRGRAYREYDPAIGERIYVRLWKGEETLREILKSDPAFPSLSVLARWRRENPAFEAMLQVAIGGWRRQRGRARLLLTEALQEEILAAIAGGHSLRSLSRLPGMPSQGTLYNWCRDRPQFARFVAYACEDREEFYLDQAVKIAEAAAKAGGSNGGGANGGGATWGARRAIARLNAQRVRLRKRPGWKRAAEAGSPTARSDPPPRGR